MRSKITVLGEAERFTSQLLEGDWVDVTSERDLAGSHVVVITDGIDVADAARRVAARAPGAIVLIATADPKAGVCQALAASLMPRARVLGVHPENVRAAARAILLEREATIEAAVLCRGEAGIENEVSVVPLVVGREGVRKIGPGA